MRYPIYLIMPSFRTFEGLVSCADRPCRNDVGCVDSAEGGAVCHCSFGFEGFQCLSTFTYILS